MLKIDHCGSGREVDAKDFPIGSSAFQRSLLRLYAAPREILDDFNAFTRVSAWVTHAEVTESEHKLFAL